MGVEVILPEQAGYRCKGEWSFSILSERDIVVKAFEALYPEQEGYRYKGV
ncbi:hypothetical protein [Cohnella sp. REN36]|nr:hypothetical protein [Cohnella sp. REN36]MCC3373984.1 hypothetical protein [Cohnella sp. REN36]